MFLEYFWKVMAVCVLLANAICCAKDENLLAENYLPDIELNKQPFATVNDVGFDRSKEYEGIYEFNNGISNPIDKGTFQSLFGEAQELTEKSETRLAKRNPEGEFIKMMRFFLKQKKNKNLADNILRSMLQEYSMKSP
ncbi:unnamed protein product [Clavelina lepadiformis]|uniref:Uncharacterized protein n=1 Tax=Clavelina lepadiformis TaxID=159417 RepID=A0ABP0GW44_CLALP